MVSERLRRFPDVSGLQALGTRFYFELDLVPLREGPEPICDDRGVMDENVGAAFLRDETKTLRVVEPLHLTVCHTGEFL